LFLQTAWRVDRQQRCRIIRTLEMSSCRRLRIFMLSYTRTNTITALISEVKVTCLLYWKKRQKIIQPLLHCETKTNEHFRMRLKHIILVVVKENTVSAVISKSIDTIIYGGVKFSQLRTKLIASGSRVLTEKLIVVTLVHNFIL
jgi:hypothetical protein